VLSTVTVGALRQYVEGFISRKLDTDCQAGAAAE